MKNKIVDICSNILEECVPKKNYRSLSKYEAMTELHQIVDITKKLFSQFDTDIKFFIAGGSVFSLLNNTDIYNDIDIFFYNNKDYLMFEHKISKLFPDPTIFNHGENIIHNNINFYKTKNAISLFDMGGNKLFQVISKHSGSIEYVFNTFDLNCSKCAITSDKEIIKSDDYSSRIEIDYNNFNSKTPFRYLKYVYEKKAIDPNDSELENMLEFSTNNLFNEYENGYDNAKTTLIFTVNSFLNNVNNTDYLNKNLNTLCNSKIYDSIISKYSEDSQIEIFKEINNLKLNRQDFLNVKCEYILPKLLNVDFLIKEGHSESYINSWKKCNQFELFQDKIQETKIKYAEYFI